MKQSRRKKKKAGPSESKIGARNCASKGEEQNIINALVEAFSLSSVVEAKVAYEQAGGDADKAADILSGLSENLEDKTESSSSSQFTDSCLNSSDGDVDVYNSGDMGVNFRGFRGNKGKKVVAATGTVSSILGKDYVPATSRNELKSSRRFSNGKVNVEEMEQFLCSMLGDECELNMAVVKDVLGQSGYDVEKALDILLDLSGPTFELSGSDIYSTHSGSSGEDAKYSDFSSDNNFWQMTDRSDSASHTSESELQDNGWPMNYGNRSYIKALVSSNSSGESYADMRSNRFELPQEVLESLFNIRSHPSIHEAGTMDWKNVVKKVESFAHKRLELSSSGTSIPQQNTYAKGNEYHELRGTAANRWSSVRANYDKAAMAYSNGSTEHAAYLSDKAKQLGKLAQEDDERASMEIFKARNKDIGNVLTIDLHGQHVKPAMRLVKLHLLFGTFVSSVQYLKVITGCGGSHGVGRSKLKQSVTALLKNEGMEWREENQGMILIKLGGPREFSFLDSESDPE